MLLRISTLVVCSLSVFILSAVAQTGTASFTYLAGPNFCMAEYGYTVPAFCNAPGELPLGSFPVPPINGTYVDPNFGATVRPITDGSTDSKHQYSTPSAFSATGKYVLILQSGGLHIVNTATAQLVADISYISDPSSARWSATDDDVLYGIGCYPCTGSMSPTQVYKYQVSTQQKTILIDYATDGHNFTYITNGGTGDLSVDNWGAFWTPNEHQVCAVDLNLLRTYCTDYTAPNPNNLVGWSFIDYAMITKGVDVDTNKRYVFLMAQPALGAYSVNLQTGQLDFEFRGPEFPAGLMGGDSGTGNHDGICDPGESCLANPHADVFEDSGRQYILVDSGADLPVCADDLVSLQISKGINMLNPIASGGGRNVITMLFACGTTWSSMHLGCAKSANAYCVISTDIAPVNLPTQIRDGKTPFDDEVIVMRGNGTELRRLAEHRSIEVSYWDQPRACISNDGSMVLWDSNFGGSNHRVVIGETGYGTSQPCSFSLSTTNLNLGAAASSGQISITPSTSSCTPAPPSSNVAWATASPSGNAVNWSVAANNSSNSRSGSIDVAGQTVAIVQAGAACSYALTTTTLTVGTASSSGTIGVTATPSDCAPATATSATSWVHVSGSGQTIGWSVDANTGSGRAGSLRIAGETVTIQQSGVTSTPPSGTSGYTRKRTITINHTKVPNTDQANFPVLFSVTDSTLKSAANGGHVNSANGYDIIFTSDSTGTVKLDHEIESYNPNTGQLIAWIRIPELSHLSDTVIYVFYGNSGVTSSQENKAAVWDSNFRAVYHFAGGATLNGNDSSSHANNLNFAGSPDAVPGQVGEGGGFSTGSPYSGRSAVSRSLLGITTRASISGWFEINSDISSDTNPNAMFGVSRYYPYNSISVGLYTNGATSAILQGGSGLHYLTSPSGQLRPGTWHHAAVTYDGSTLRYYLDGALSSSLSNRQTWGDSYARILDLDTFARYSNINVDEFKVSGSVRSADWIATEYNNQASPGTFVILGAEQ